MKTSSLITFSESWHRSPWLYERLGYATSGDAILLMQDAVFALQSPLLLASFIAKCEASKVSIYCLQTDCEIRGVDLPAAPVKTLDDQQWLKLVFNFDKQVAF